MPYVPCVICDVSFYAKPRHVKLGWGKYCSRKCQYMGQRKGKMHACGICGKMVYRTPSDLWKADSKRFFCGKSCLAKWKNSHAPRGADHFNWKDGSGTYRNIMLRNKKKPLCTSCGLKNERVLVVHHVDHNRKNNTLKNLLWLCRNCHYLAHEGKTV